jgi:hypothetical protein
MTTEEIVRKYRRRAGYRVADYGEIGIPVWVLSLQTITMVHKKLSAIDEFVLKCLEAGLAREAEIGEFLGLGELVVRNSLASLVLSDDVTVGSAPGTRVQSVRITAKGKKTLASAETVVPEESTFTVYFDGLLRKVAWYASFDLVKRRDLQEEGTVEIPASPGGRPKIADLPVEEVRRVIATKLRTKDGKRELLAIKSVRTIENRFLPAVAVVYKSDDTALGTQIAFFVDGKLSEAHESAFALSGGSERMRLEETLASTPKDLEEVLAAKKLLTAESEQEAEALIEQTAVANQIIEQSQRTLELSEQEPERVEARTRLDDAKSELEKAKTALAQLPVRFLYVYDHPTVLEDALSDTTKRLLLVSPWIQRAVVNDKFIDRLKKLLSRAVEVYIGYGLGEDVEKNNLRAVSQLKKVSEQYGNFHFVWIGDTHAKVLVQDDVVVITSFNWLSFKGDPARTFRDEQGVLIRNKQLADEKFEALMKWFDPSSPLVPGRI